MIDEIDTDLKSYRNLATHLITSTLHEYVRITRKMYRADSGIDTITKRQYTKSINQEEALDLYCQRKSLITWINPNNRTYQWCCSVMGFEPEWFVIKFNNKLDEINCQYDQSLL